MIKLKKDISHYEGLITVFALISVVIYSSDKYDIWDIYLGIIVTYIGIYGYWNKAKEEDDFFYSLLTSTILSLGIITILSGIFYTIAILIKKYYHSFRMERIEEWVTHLSDYQFEIIHIQFLVFLILMIFLMYKIKNKVNTK